MTGSAQPITLTDSAQPITDTGTGSTPDAPAGTPPAATSEPGLTQAQVNAILAKERKAWEAAAKQRADDDLKAKQGEWEALATQRQQALDRTQAELESRDQRLAALSEEMDKQAKARVRVLPDELKAMAPEGDVLALYAWLSKAEAAAAKLAPKPATGTPPGPRGTGSAPMSTPDDLIARKRAQGGYDA